MNKRKYAIYFVLAFVFFGFMSCKNGAEAKKDVAPEQVETEVEKADETVKKEGQVSKPKKDAVEKPVKPAKPEQPKVDPAKVQYESISKKAKALSKECKDKKVNNLFPEEFAIAEADMKKAEADARIEKYSSAKVNAQKAVNRYQTLLNLGEAHDAKTEIDENSFVYYGEQEYENAEKQYAKALESFKTNDRQALEASKSSLTNYNKVLNAGYVEWVKLAKNSAQRTKEDCDSIKANRSMSKEYSSALASFKKAQAFETKRAYKDAYNSYTEAGESFSKIFEVVSVKRAEAEKAIEAAKKKQEESSKLAAEADLEAPLEEVLKTVDSEAIKKEVDGVVDEDVVDEGDKVVNEVEKTIDETIEEIENEASDYNIEGGN